MGVYLNLPVTTTADIAAAVRTELALELARIDAAISTRARPVDVQVTVTAPTRGQVDIT